MKNLYSLGLRHENNRLLILDQQKLPNQEIWLESKSPQDMVEMIQKLKVRGAPLIGVAAALALAKFVESNPTPPAILEAAQLLRNARPTAVNLMNAIDRLVPSVSEDNLNRELIIQSAVDLFEEDVQLCDSMAENGQALIESGDSILTHCNTGGLATVGIGTALGVIRKAHEYGKKVRHVYVDETRPLLQGARLTTWELMKVGIPFTLICDSMSATLMKQGKVQKIFVGADRIARNGDFANKIGTYSVAVLANYHQVPFYTVAPWTTVDLHCPSGEKIPVEQRDPEEVRGEYAPRNCNVWNPSFDVTPAELLSGLVLDQGVFTTEQFKTFTSRL